MRFFVSSALASLNGNRAPRLLARRISLRARASLVSGFAGRLVGSYSSGLLALDDAGRPLHITSARGVIGPFSIQVVASGDSFSRTIQHLSPTARVTGDGTRLRIGVWTVDVADATPWSPFVDWPFLGDRHHWRLSIANRLLSLTVPPSASRWENRVENVLHLRAKEFCSALNSLDVRQVERASLALAGLGPGLTPAGDDYLAGAVLALHTVRASVRATIASAILAGAHGRTTRISWAILQAACLGEASEPWHHLAEAVCKADPHRILLAAKAVRRMGQSSGTWSLRGFLDTLAAVDDAEGAAASPPPPQKGVPMGRSA